MGEPAVQGFSLNPDLIANIFQYARPLGHNEEPENSNLGFGFLYYGLVRALRPSHALVIGSGFGFSVVCLALGLKDNGRGRLTFVDPSYDVFRDGPFKTVGGRGMWGDPGAVSRHFRLFGVEERLVHYKLTNREFFPRYEGLGLPAVDIAFVDGNHSYEDVRYDVSEVLRRSRKHTYILLHDTNLYIREMLRHAGVRRCLRGIKKRRDLLECIDFPFSSGVAMVHVLKEDAWRHLSWE
jgi:hypothetical protein